MVLSNEKIIFEGGSNEQKSAEGIYSYRIPALLKTKAGTLIAGADQRHNHKNDWGNIDMVVRRSEDNGENWGEIIKVLDLPTNQESLNPEFDSALLIDMNLVQDPDTARIFAVYDMYPEQRGLFGMLEENRMRENDNLESINEKEYSNVNGVAHLNLYNSEEQLVFMVDEDGAVVDLEGKETDMTVTLKSKTPPFTDTGNLYKNGELIGNIYLAINHSEDLRIAKASYIWLSYSDDDGKTWSSPKDITPQIKLPWMKFYGVGPGIGLVLEHGDHRGRLIIPTYSTNHPFELDYSQSARVIYSDDHGETWQSGHAVNDNRQLDDGTTIHSESMFNEMEQNTEACAVELRNGQVKLFMRNKSGSLAVATSYDGGETWGESTLEYYPEVNESYVQLSAISTLQDGIEYIVLVNAEGPLRTNGHIRVARVGDNGELTWIHSHLIQEGDFAYNALQQIDSNTFACLYEHRRGDQNYFSLYFRTFDWEYAVKD